MTRNVRLTKPTPGSASHLVPVTPLTTHVSRFPGSPGGNAWWGEEAWLLLTVGERWLYWLQETQAAPSAVLAQRGPQAQSRAKGVENQGQGDMTEKGVEGDCRKGECQAHFLWEQAAPPSWSGKSKGFGAERPGFESCNLLLCDPGQVTSPL